MKVNYELGYVYSSVRDLACTAPREQSSDDFSFELYFLCGEKGPESIRECDYKQACNYLMRRAVSPDELAEIVLTHWRTDSLAFFAAPSPVQRRANHVQRCIPQWRSVLNTPALTAGVMQAVNAAFSVLSGTSGPAGSAEQLASLVMATAQRIRPGRSLAGANPIDEARDYAVCRLWATRADSTLDELPFTVGLQEPNSRQIKGAIESIQAMLGPSGTLLLLIPDVHRREVMRQQMLEVRDQLSRLNST